jgi:hypothetical protein
MTEEILPTWWLISLAAENTGFDDGDDDSAGEAQVHAHYGNAKPANGGNPAYIADRGALEAHLDSCGFPHVDGSEYRSSFNSVDYEMGDHLIVALVPVITSEWADVLNNMDSTIAELFNATAGDKQIIAWLVSPRDLPADLSVDQFWSRLENGNVHWTPRDNESMPQWLDRIVLRSDRLMKIWDRWEASGRQIEHFKRMEPRASRTTPADEVTFLVDGLIQSKALTLFTGVAGAGKSTVLTELAVAVASDGDGLKWLGRDVNANASAGVVVLLSGEDNSAILDHRIQLLDPTGDLFRLLPMANDNRRFAEIVSKLETLPAVPLLIVDPARKYLVGGESNDEVVNDFLSIVEGFVERTGAAVVVVHHLSKDARPTSLDNFKSAIRGSQLWIDRPRAIVGMYRVGDQTKIGIVKHNLPPQFPMMPETVFERDPASLRHLPATGGEGGRPQSGQAVLDLVREAVRRLNAAGRPVFRTGKNGVYEMCRREFTGVARAKIWAAVDQLIGSGQFASDDNGLRCVTSEAVS